MKSHQRCTGHIFPSVFFLSALLISLAVNSFAQTNCAPSSSGLVGWWRGEGNAVDQISGTVPTVFAGTTFGPGKVGQGINFDGANSGVVIPASSNLAFQSLTVEGWIRPIDMINQQPIVEYANPTGYCSMNFWYNIGENITPNYGGLSAFLRNPDLSAEIAVNTAPGLLISNQWNHVAMTYDFGQRVLRVYHNGLAVGARTSSVPHETAYIMINSSSSNSSTSTSSTSSGSSTSSRSSGSSRSSTSTVPALPLPGSALASEVGPTKRPPNINMNQANIMAIVPMLNVFLLIVCSFLFHAWSTS